MEFEYRVIRTDTNGVCTDHSFNGLEPNREGVFETEEAAQAYAQDRYTYSSTVWQNAHQFVVQRRPKPAPWVTLANL